MVFNICISLLTFLSVTSASASTNNICPSTSVGLTANGATAGTGTTLTWYTSTCGTGSNLGSGNTLMVSPATTTTYYARLDGTCNTAETSVMVAVKTSSHCVLAQIGLEPDSPDTVNSVVTATQLNTIIGLTGVVPANETGYQDYMDDNPGSFSSPEILAEVKL